LSARLIGPAFDRARTTRPTELLVLLAIIDDARDDGHGAYPAVARIAKRTRLSERTVRSALRGLERSGDLTVIRHPGRKHANDYIVTLAPEKVQQVHLLPPEKVQQLPGKGAGAAPHSLIDPLIRTSSNHTVVVGPDSDDEGREDAPITDANALASLRTVTSELRQQDGNLDRLTAHVAACPACPGNVAAFGKAPTDAIRHAERVVRSMLNEPDVADLRSRWHAMAPDKGMWPYAAIEIQQHVMHCRACGGTMAGGQHYRVTDLLDHGTPAQITHFRGVFEKMAAPLTV
jgi:hypothetical protein